MMGYIFLVNSSAAGEIKTNWIYKRSNSGAAYVLKIYKIELVRNQIRFHMLYHNTSNQYACFHASADEKMLYMDDELGNEYFGADFRILDGKTNKLAPNQRKKAIWEISAPVEDVNFVNLRMGFNVSFASSTSECGEPNMRSDINEHKINWDISKLRN
ncbi:MAG: hypothetical protein COA93_10690 [Alphaproteobacteria bacterium]|nr:MAG: hypothetical protein COA93_10690 [Alphaproteobacteria bacterium]